MQTHLGDGRGGVGHYERKFNDGVYEVQEDRICSSFFGGDQMRIPLSTAIDAALYKECKARGLKWNQLIKAGFLAQTQPTASVEAVRQHTADIERLKSLLESANRTIRGLRTEVAAMQSEEVQP